MKLKYNWIFFLLSFVAILGTRVYQFFNVNNLAVKNQANTIEIIIFSCTAFFSLLIILMTALSKNNLQKFKLHKNNSLATISFIFGVFLIANGISNIICLFNSINVEIILLFMGAFSILSGAIFFVLGKSFLRGKNEFLRYQLLLIIPVLWLCTRLLGFFFKYSSLALPIQKMSGEIAVIFLLLFSLHFARLVSGLCSKKNFKRACMYAFSAILFSFLSITFESLTMVYSGTFTVYSGVSFITDATFCVFVALFVASLSKNSLKENQDDLLPESTDEDEVKSQEPEETKPEIQVTTAKAEATEPEPEIDQESSVESQDSQKENSGSEKKQSFDMSSINKLIDEISKK